MTTKPQLTASQQDIAQFFRLSLRIGIVDTGAVERWVDSIVEKEPTVIFPFTELAGASHLSISRVDELLGQVSGASNPHVPGRIAVALIRRRVLEGSLPFESAIKHVVEISFSGPLTEDERSRADFLQENLWLATHEGYGSPKRVQIEIKEFLEKYAEYDSQIPETI
jgi:hypothetical protein